jgi:hypothetical protein
MGWINEGVTLEGTNAFAQLQSGAHQLSSSIWMFGIGLPNSAAVGVC